MYTHKLSSELSKAFPFKLCSTSNAHLEESVLELSKDFNTYLQSNGAIGTQFGALEGIRLHLDCESDGHLQKLSSELSKVFSFKSYLKSDGHLRISSLELSETFTF